MAADSSHRLAGAIEKFNRSRRHFDELRSEMDAFFNADPGPYCSEGRFDRDAWEWIETFRVIEEPPMRFGVMLGDAVHNLRSCLDHMIWQVVLLDGGTPTTKTQFPIVSGSEKMFEGWANTCLAGLNAQHREMVKRAQPFVAGDRAGTHVLAILRDLSNTDKHRIVNPTLSFVDEEAGPRLERLIESYEGDGASPVRSWWMLSRPSLVSHGEPWLRIALHRSEEPPANVKISGGLSLGVTFGEMRFDASGFKDIAEYVRRVLEMFLAEFPETEYTDE